MDEHPIFRCRCEWCHSECGGHYDRTNKHLSAIPIGSRVVMICDTCRTTTFRLFTVRDTFITRAINGVLGRLQ